VKYLVIKKKISAAMDYRDDVKRKIGEEPYELLISEIEGGRISLEQVKDIGLRLDKTNKVNGVFEAQRSLGHVKPKDVWRHMLDKYWEVELHKPTVDGLNELINSLNECGLLSVAHQMKRKPDHGEELLPSAPPKCAATIENLPYKAHKNDLIDPNFNLTEVVSSPNSTSNITSLVILPTTSSLNSATTEHSLLMEEKEPVSGEKDSSFNLRLFLPTYKCVVLILCAVLILLLSIIIFLVFRLGSSPSSNEAEGSSELVTESLTTSSRTTSRFVQAQDVKQIQGLIVLAKSGIVEWINRCPTKKLHLSDLPTPIHNYGRIQVEDQLWVCGGTASRNDERNLKSQTCLILNLSDGKWRTFEHKMNHPRIKPWMSLDGNRVLVMGGTTSGILVLNSLKSCLMV
jgi:hypothetical protein